MYKLYAHTVHMLFHSVYFAPIEYIGHMYSKISPQDNDIFEENIVYKKSDIDWD